MKWILRSATLIILATAVGLIFFLKVENGQPRLALPDTSSWTLPEMPDASFPDLPDFSGAKVTTVYKWQDADGRWHYGDTPPENQQFDELKVSDQTNVIPSLTDADRARLAPVPAKADAAENVTPTLPSADSDGGITQALNVLNDAKAVGAQVEARNREVQRVIEGQR